MIEKSYLGIGNLQFIQFLFMRYLSLLSGVLLLGLLAFTPKGKSSKRAYKQFEKAYSNFTFIPGGTWTSDKDLSKGNSFIDVDPKMNITQSFWMSKYEVSNADWKTFLKDIRLSQGIDSAKKLLPDTNQWTSLAFYNEPMRHYYFRHPAYANYPVSSVSLKQCLAYCNWLESKIMRDLGVFLKDIDVRLPTENEWEYAASAGDTWPYPWGTYLRNSKGNFLANFRQVPMDRIKKVNGKLVLNMEYNESGAHFTPAPVSMYHENEFGLFNMGGNVAEFVQTNPDEPDPTGALAQYGITRGGSFYDPPYYMQNSVRDFYPNDSSAHFSRGFRPVITFSIK